MAHSEDTGRGISSGADGTAALVPQRRAWITYFRVWFLVFWLLIAGAGLLLAALPVSFALKDLLSGAILGAGIAGIFSEFSFCSERRDDDIDRQVLEIQITGLDRQLRRIDRIATDSATVATLKTFKLGSYLAMVQHSENLSKEARDSTREQIEELAEILGISRVVSPFLNQSNMLDAQAAAGLLSKIVPGNTVALLRSRSGCVQNWLCYGSGRIYSGKPVNARL